LVLLGLAAGAEEAELDPEPDVELDALDSLPGAAFVSDLVSFFESDFVSGFLSALSPDAEASPLDELLDEPLLGA
jgi:hypothetical protein